MSIRPLVRLFKSIIFVVFKRGLRFLVSFNTGSIIILKLIRIKVMLAERVINMVISLDVFIIGRETTIIGVIIIESGFMRWIIGFVELSIIVGG